MIDVAVAIDAEAIPTTLTRVGSAGGSYSSGGKWVPNAPVTVPDVMATVQPATNGKTLQDLPEGLRSEARWLIWSRMAFVLNDRFTFSGATYKVIFMWPRNIDGGHYRAVLGEYKP